MKLARDLGKSVPDTRQPRHGGKYAFEYVCVCVCYCVLCFQISTFLVVLFFRLYIRCSKYVNFHIQFSTTPDLKGMIGVIINVM